VKPKGLFETPWRFLQSLMVFRQTLGSLLKYSDDADGMEHGRTSTQRSDFENSEACHFREWS